MRTVWGSHHDITEAPTSNLQWRSRGSRSSPPSAAFSCATVRENFKSTPRHASQSSPRTSNQKQTWSKREWWGGREGCGGGVRGKDSRTALIIPHPIPTTTTTSSHMDSIVLWAHQRGVMTSPQQSQASHIIITAYCSKSNPCSALTHTRTHTHKRERDRDLKRPLHMLINYNGDLLDTMGVQISCIFLTVKGRTGKNPNKIKETIIGDLYFYTFTTSRIVLRHPRKAELQCLKPNSYKITHEPRISDLQYNRGHSSTKSYCTTFIEKKTWGSQKVTKKKNTIFQNEEPGHGTVLHLQLISGEDEPWVTQWTLQLISNSAPPVRYSIFDIIYNTDDGAGYPACTGAPLNHELERLTPVDCITGPSDRKAPECGWKKRLDPERIPGGTQIGHSA